jgi:hypothetical protein
VFLTFSVGKTSSLVLVQHQARLEFYQNTAKWPPDDEHSFHKCYDCVPKPKLYAQIVLIIVQNLQLLAWLDSGFCFLLNLLDSFFCYHSLQILKYIRKVLNHLLGATEGLVQHTLQAIWVLGLI